jgi:hypothetical protein
MFDSRWGVPLLVHHSYSGTLLHYDVLVQQFRDGSVVTWRYRFTEVAEVRVKSLLNDAAREEAWRMRVQDPGAVDGEAPWGVPVNEILSATRTQRGGGQRIVIESTAQELTIDYRDVEQDMVLPGYSAYAVVAYPGTTAE